MSLRSSLIKSLQDHLELIRSGSVIRRAAGRSIVRHSSRERWSVQVAICRPAGMHGGSGSRRIVVSGRSRPSSGWARPAGSDVRRWPERFVRLQHGHSAGRSARSGLVGPIDRKPDMTLKKFQGRSREGWRVGRQRHIVALKRHHHANRTHQLLRLGNQNDRQEL